MTVVCADGNGCVLGIDIGGTKIAVAAVDAGGEMLVEGEFPSPSRDGDAMVEAFGSLIGREFDRYREKGLDVRAVGIAAAGYILQGEGILLESPNIAWRMVPLRQIAVEVTGLPAFLDNDANGAAAGERFVGAARGVDDFVYLTLGTGVGGGVYVGGKPLRGHRGMGAELGHIVIDPNGPVCGCGHRGCLEVFASGTALGREAAGVVAGDTDSVLLEMAGGEAGRITGKMVSRAAERGDRAALRAYEIWSGYLGMGIVDLIHIFDPELVVLGGGVSESGHLFIDSVRRAVSERGIASLVEGVRIVLSELGNEAGVVGAAGLAWEGIRERVL
ncbi:MAG: ROK family protein [Actinobacteria bacterium]|nr:ROK family protein [Actinomycetota bacterium]